ncbi:hypothetical protein ACOME3_003793 [Neoechinorhynchus agilis]
MSLASPSYFAFLCSIGYDVSKVNELVKRVLCYGQLTARIALLEAYLCSGWAISEFSNDRLLLNTAFSNLCTEEQNIKVHAEYIFTVFDKLCTRIGAKDRICGTVLKFDNLAFNCRSCETKRQGFLCRNCFEHGGHFLHDYRYLQMDDYTICSCGDREKFNANFSCFLHSRKNEAHRLSSKELEMIMVTMKPILVELAEVIIINLRIMNMLNLNERQKSEIRSLQQSAVFRYVQKFGESTMPLWLGSSLASTIICLMLNRKIEDIACNRIRDHSLEVCKIEGLPELKPFKCENILSELIYWSCRTGFPENLSHLLVGWYLLAQRILRQTLDEKAVNNKALFSFILFSNISIIKEKEMLIDLFNVILYSCKECFIECENCLVPATVRYDGRSLFTKPLQMVLNPSCSQMLLLSKTFKELRCVLGDSNATEIFIGQKNFFAMWVDILVHLQGMIYTGGFKKLDDSLPNTISVAERLAWKTSFHLNDEVVVSILKTLRVDALSIQPSPIKTLLESIYYNLKIKQIISALAQVLKGIDHWCKQAGFNCNLMDFENENVGIANDALDFSLTFHLPLHRLLSNLIFVLKEHFKLSLSQIFDELKVDIHLLERILAHPVQLQCAVSEEPFNPAIKWNCSKYTRSKSPDISAPIDQDRFLIRAICSRLPTENLILTFFRRFKLLYDYLQNPEFLVRSINNGTFGDTKFSSPNHYNNVRSFMTLIAQLTTCPVSLNPYNLNEHEKEVTTALYIGDKTFSEIEDFLPTYSRCSKQCRQNLRNTLEKVADYMPPTVNTTVAINGFYKLKNRDSFDALFTLYRTARNPLDYSKAILNYTKWISDMIPDLPDHTRKNIWLPDLPVHNDHCNKLVNSRYLHQLIFLILRAYPKCSQGHENVLYLLINLLRIALKTRDKYSIREKALEDLYCVYENDDVLTNVLQRVKDSDFQGTMSLGGPCTESSPCEHCKPFSEDYIYDCFEEDDPLFNSPMVEKSTQTCLIIESQPQKVSVYGSETSIFCLLVELLATASAKKIDEALMDLSDQDRVKTLILNENPIEIRPGLQVWTEISHLCDLIRLVLQLSGNEDYLYDCLNTIPSAISVIEKSSTSNELKKEKLVSAEDSILGQFLKNKCTFDETQCCVICQGYKDDKPFGILSYKQKTDLASRQYLNLTTDGKNTEIVNLNELHKEFEIRLIDFALASHVDLQTPSKTSQKLEEILHSSQEIQPTFHTSTLNKESDSAQLENLLGTSSQRFVLPIRTIFDLYPLSECFGDDDQSETTVTESEDFVGIPVIDDSFPSSYFLSSNQSSFPVGEAGKKDERLKSSPVNKQHVDDLIDDDCTIAKPVSFFVDLTNCDFSDYLHFQSCGHHVHLECSYRFLSEGLCCPMCGRRCNTVVPNASMTDSSDVADIFIEENVKGNDDYTKGVNLAGFIRNQLESDLLQDFNSESRRCLIFLGNLFYLFRKTSNLAKEHFTYLIHSLYAIESKVDEVSPFMPIIFYDPLILIINLVILSDENPLDAFQKHVGSIYELGLVQSLVAIALSEYDLKNDKSYTIRQFLKELQSNLKMCGFVERKNKIYNTISKDHILALQFKIVAGLAYLKFSLLGDNWNQMTEKYISIILNDNQCSHEAFETLCKFIGLNVNGSITVSALNAKCWFWINQISAKKCDESVLKILSVATTFQGLAARSLLKPKIAQLPRTLDMLHLNVAQFKCPQCEHMPFSDHLKWNRNVTRLCLVCSVPFVSVDQPSKIFCCNQMKKTSLNHANKVCCAHLGIEMNVRNSAVSISTLEGASKNLGALYIDINGEADYAFTRQVALYLNKERFKFLQSEWIKLRLNPSIK